MFDLTVGSCPFEFDSLSSLYLKNLNFDEVCFKMHLAASIRYLKFNLKILSVKPIFNSIMTMVKLYSQTP